LYWISGILDVVVFLIAALVLTGIGFAIYGVAYLIYNACKDARNPVYNALVINDV
jgi:hypothetical protein